MFVETTYDDYGSHVQSIAVLHVSQLRVDRVNVESVVLEDVRSEECTRRYQRRW